MNDTELLEYKQYYLLFVKKLYEASDTITTIDLLKGKIDEIIIEVDREIEVPNRVDINRINELLKLLYN